jgi:hypothetical protein
MEPEPVMPPPMVLLLLPGIALPLLKVPLLVLDPPRVPDWPKPPLAEEEVPGWLDWPLMEPEDELPSDPWREDELAGWPGCCVELLDPMELPLAPEAPGCEPLELEVPGVLLD